MSSHHPQLEAAQALDWPRLIDVLASHAHSSQGKTLCATLSLETDLQTARLRQEETSEMAALCDATDAFPAVGFPDISDVLIRAGKGAMLEPRELRDCALVLGVAEAVEGFLRRHREDAPRLQALARPLEEVASLRRLKAALDAAILPDGSIAESATGELRRLTRQAHDLKQRMRDQLEHILHSRRYADVLQETYFAQRQGRYVVPIKVEMQGRIPGILHDVSASGATVFLEPRELIDLNNAIKVADLDIDREVRRILKDFSTMVSERAAVLEPMLTVLARLDCIRAKAGLSRQVRGQPVVINDRGRVLLRRARHPLLVLSREHVVANDILFDESVQVLIITGPNTGGKTVTLKILGLFALMVRAGLHVPCDAGSEMALFTSIYADIGDAQDLTKDLSSFSAHITRMVRLLAEVANRLRPPASAEEHRTGEILVLLDEPVTSTDPTEGAALATALLLYLARHGLKVVATTHYSELKALAQSTPGFSNASVQFDLATLSPTYRVVMGLPGGSAALEIAGRLGMAASILDEARDRLQRNDRLLEQLLSDVQERQRQLTVDLDRARQAREAAEEAAAKSTSMLDRLRASEWEERKAVKRKLMQEFQRARAQVQATLDELKREQKAEKAKAAKRRLMEIEAVAGRDIDPPKTSGEDDPLEAGTQVELAGLGILGTLLESPEGKKRVRVKVGEGEVLATVTDLICVRRSSFPIPAAGQRRHTADWHASTISVSHEPPAIVDVRGRTGDEAIELIVSALDKAALAGQSVIRLVHGYGTGRLKAVLRTYLSSSPYVARFRPGERAEGGDGVTIVELK